MLFKTFIRKQLRLKAHTVTEIEPSDEQMVVQIERLGARKLCCSRCSRPYRRVHSRAVRERSWRDLSLRQAPLSHPPGGVHGHVGSVMRKQSASTLPRRRFCSIASTWCSI